MGWKRDALAYEKALKRIQHAYRPITQTGHSEAYFIATQALKGEYHETDFTEFCKRSEGE
jgi:hypothetical protein